MVSMVDPAREDIVNQRAATSLQPGQQARTRIGHQLELHRLTGLRLDDDRPSSDLPAQDDIADFDLHNIAAAELAVDRQVEKRPVSRAAVLVEKEADGPDLPWFQRPLGPDLSPRIPGATVGLNRIIF
jgi:hypothetical protein